MENILSSGFSALVNEVKRYIELRYNYTRLDIIEKLIVSVSFFAIFLVFLFFITVIVLFLAIATAFYLGKLMDSFFLGFMTMAGLFFVLFWVVYFFRKPLIIRPVQEKLLKQIFKTEDNEEE